MKSSVLLLIIFLAFYYTAYNVYGDSGAEFLNIGVNPRAIALGNAYSAVADDSSAVFWNPAGLNRIFNSEIFFMHQSWLFDTDMEFLSAAGKFRYGVAGLSLSYFHTAEFELFGEAGETMGNASVYDLLFIASYANKFNSLLYGINFKYIKRAIADVNSSAFAGDIGFIYNINFFKLYKSPLPNMALAFSIKNLGTKLQYETEGESLPVTFTAGFKYSIISKMNRALFLANDISYRKDESPIIGLGMEFNVSKIFFMRGGFKLEEGQTQLSMGAGISYDISSLNLNIDMALFKYNEETLYPYSLGLKSSMNKSVKVSPVEIKRDSLNAVLITNAKIIIGFLNFKNLSAKDELTYLSSAIPESVNTILSKNTNLTIIETVKINAELGAMEINDENQYNFIKLYSNLGIRHLITGSYLEIDKMVKVNLKIIDVKDNTVIYGKSIDGPSGKNIFSLIDKIAEDLTAFYEKPNK